MSTMQVKKDVKVQKNTYKPPKGLKKGLSESQLAYALIAPALIMILVMALFPVVRSFWLSLFDLRLNHPTKSKVYLSHRLNMERYAGDYPYLEQIIKEAADEAQGDVKIELVSVRDKILHINTTLMSDQGIKKQYDQVSDLQMRMKPVGETLQYVSIDGDTAKSMIQIAKEVDEQLHKIKDTPGLKQIVKEIRDITKDAVAGAIIVPNFVGLGNYAHYLKDARLAAALGNTFLFTICSVSFELVLGLLVALSINRSFKGRGLVRAAILVPWAIPTVVSSLMWQFMYDGQTGIVAHIFAWLRLIPDSGYLLTTRTGAMFSVILADVWKTTPYMALLLLAGLQTIDASLYEAANVDGGTKWQQFWSITLPLLKSTMLVALLFRTLDAFRIFDLIFVLTGGGPANSTETVSVYAYKMMFNQMDFGKGSTLSFIVFICIALISIGYIKILGADVLKD